MNMPERVREGVNMGGQNLRTYGILKLFNAMVTLFCIRGGGGGGEVAVRLIHLKAIQMHAGVSVG